MAKKQDPAELADIAEKLERLIEKLGAGTERFSAGLSRSTRQALDLANVFDDIADNAKDEIPKGILTGKDLQKEMLKDAKLFEKIQQKTQKIIKDTLDQGWERIVEKGKERYKDQQKLDKYLEKEKERWSVLSEFVTKDTEKQFLLLKRQEKEQKKITLNFANAKKEVDRLEGALRKPGTAIENMITSAGDLPNKIAKSVNEGKTLGQTFKESIPLINGLSSAITKFGIAAGTALTIATMGLAALVAAITLAFKAFMSMYDFIDKKVMPTQAKLNQEFGNASMHMKEMSKQAVSTGVRFEYLGRSFEEGAQVVADLSKGFQRMIPKEAFEGALKLSEVMGIGAEQTGKLHLQADRAGMSLADLQKGFKDAGVAALNYGQYPNQIRKDMAEDISLMQRFGIQNIKTYSISAAKARQYGLSIKEVNAAFGKTLDTFEGSSDAAAKLNSIFGTHINSYKLMLEADPTKRMQMLRKELLNQGKSWEKLSVFEKNVITSTMGVNEEQAAMVLGSKKTVDELKKVAAEKKNQEKIDKEWKQGLASLSTTIAALQPRVDNLFRALSQMFSTLFGLGDSGDNMVEAGKQMAHFIDKLTAGIEKLTKYLDGDFKKSFAGRMLGKLLGIEKVEPPKEVLDILNSDKADEDKDRVLRGISKVGYAQDALITKKGEFIKFDPDDNIMATKSPIATHGRGATATAGKGANAGGQQSLSEIRVEVMDIHLDGKKIGEAQVRISRY